MVFATDGNRLLPGDLVTVEGIYYDDSPPSSFEYAYTSDSNGAKNVRFYSTDVAVVMAIVNEVPFVPGKGNCAIVMLHGRMVYISPAALTVLNRSWI